LGGADVSRRWDRQRRRREVEKHIGLALWIARRHYGSLLEREEAEGAALEGLVRAANQYDPRKGRFTPYAVRRVKAAIVDAVRRERDFRTKKDEGVEVVPVDPDLIIDKAPAVELEDPVIAHLDVMRAVAVLPDRLLRIVFLVRLLGVGPSEIAPSFGVGGSRISQLCSDGEARLRLALAVEA
jgi:RNA polymerase sigma factor (sigma-70 family)